MKLPKHPVALAFNNASSSSTTTTSSIARKALIASWRQSQNHNEHYSYTFNAPPISSSTPTPPKPNRIITVRQFQCGEQTGVGTGAVVWPAAQILMKYLEKLESTQSKAPTSVSTRAIVLGCGTGIEGCVYSEILSNRHRDKRHHVHNTDVGEVLKLTSENVSSYLATTTTTDPDDDLNNFNVELTVGSYMWGEELTWVTDSAVPDDKTFDVILVSDCILPKLYPIEPLVDAIAKLLSKARNGVCYVSYEHRLFAHNGEHFDPKLRFFELCAAAGLHVTTVADEELDELYRMPGEVDVWVVQWVKR